MATWTANELAESVLIHLGIVAAGTTPAAEDTKVVTDAWASIYPQMRRLRLAPFAAGTIEEEYQEPLSRYVAGQVYMKFGITGAREGTILRAAQQGWIQIQEQAGADRSPVDIRPDYF